jgi:hypothetical protein
MIALHTVAFAFSLSKISVRDSRSGLDKMQANGAASSSVHSLDTIRGPSFSSTQSSEWGSNAKTRNATTRSNCQKLEPYLLYPPSLNLFACVRLMLQSFVTPVWNVKERRLFRIRNGHGGVGGGIRRTGEKTANLRQPGSTAKKLEAPRNEKREKPKTPRSMYVSGIYMHACISREMLQLFFCLRV